MFAVRYPSRRFADQRKSITVRVENDDRRPKTKCPCANAHGHCQNVKLLLSPTGVDQALGQLFSMLLTVSSVD